MSGLIRSFQQKKTDILNELQSLEHIDSLEELGSIKSKISLLETFFSQSAKAYERAINHPLEIDLKKKKIYALSFADSLCFTVATVALGLGIFDYQQTLTLEIAAVCFIASQIFSKLTDYTSIKAHHREFFLALVENELSYIQKESWIIKILKNVICDKESSEEEFKNSWRERRQFLLISLGVQRGDLHEVDLGEPAEEVHLLA